MVILAGDSRAAEYVRFNFGRVVIVPDLDAWVRHPVTKVISVGDAAPADRLLPRARADFAGRADVTVSHPKFLEFVAPGVSKGAAVRWLARRLGIDLRDTLAIGDQLNDLEMIEEAGSRRGDAARPGGAPGGGGPGGTAVRGGWRGAGAGGTCVIGAGPGAPDAHASAGAPARCLTVRGEPAGQARIVG